MNHFMHFSKKIVKNQKIFEKCHNFQKIMSNSSYTYFMREKIICVDTEFNREAREQV
jgi:hypothetical protein